MTQTTFIHLLYPFISVLIGFVLVRFTNRVGYRSISAVLLFILIPAYYFQQALGQNVRSPEFSYLLFFYLFHTASLYLVTRGVLTLIGYPKPLHKICLLNVMITSILGLRLIQGILSNSVQTASLILIISFYHSVILALLGMYLVGSKNSTFTAGIRKIFTTPLVYAVLAGIVLAIFQASLPYSLLDVVDKWQGAAVPLTLLLVGIFLGNTIFFLDVKSYSNNFPSVLLCTVLRLVVSPLLAWVIAHLMGIENPAMVKILILASALPTGIFACALISYYGKGVENVQVLLTVITSTILAFITIPLLNLLLNKYITAGA